MSAILHTDRIPFEVWELADKDIELLTNILSQPIWTPETVRRSALDEEVNMDRKQAVTRLVQDLPSHLRRPIPKQTKVVNFIARHCDIPPASQLCKAHTRLNSQIIQMILAALEIEVGKRLNTLASDMQRLSEAHRDLVTDLRALHALWLPPRNYRANFLREPESKWAFQPDECGACILARIGEDAKTLLLLRTALLARQQRHRPEPRLIRWIDGWISWTGLGNDIIRESEKRAQGLRKARISAKRRTRRVSRRRLSTIREQPVYTKDNRVTAKSPSEEDRRRENDDEDENNGGECSDDEDFAESIFNCYTSPVNTHPVLARDNPRRNDVVHPRPSSSRYSLLSRDQARNDDRVDDRVYSTNKGNGPLPKRSTAAKHNIRRDVQPGAKSAQTRAEEYQALLGEIPGSDRQRRDSRSSVQTRWSRFM